MVGRYYFFELDFYGVSFYEEEIPTARQQRWAAAIEGPASVLFQLESEDQDYNVDWDVEDRAQCSSPEPEGVELQKPVNVAAKAVLQPPPRSIRKIHKFTPGQLYELQLVFQVNPYPDSSQRRELAQLFNVDERTVTYWFSNRRAKIKRDERILQRRGSLRDIQNNLSIKNFGAQKCHSTPRPSGGWVLTECATP